MSERTDEIEESDVVIVGGGLAGLVTARELGRAGLRAVVLEARDRLGGRVWTDHRLGRDLEMGGAWVHWVQPHVWSEITRYGLEVTRGPRPREAYWLAGDHVRTGTLDSFMDLIDPGMSRLLAGTDELVPRPDDPTTAPELAGADALTVQDRLDELGLPEEEYRANEAAWVGHFNGPLTRGGFASALRWTAAAGGSWRLMHEASATFRLATGTRGLVTSIAADAGAVADVRTSSPVRRVERNGDGVTVVTGDGRRARARRAVLTLPLNILGRLDVDPPLSGAKLAASRAGAASTGVKVWIRVRGPIAPFFGYSSADHPLSVVRTEFLGDDDAVLVAFGADSTRIAPDSAGVGAVADALRTWRDDLQVLEVTGHDWMSDPYSRETWMMHRPGQLTGCLPELQRSEGPLHLAGSDYADLWAGFMDGAIESGLCASRRIAAELGTDSTP